MKLVRAAALVLLALVAFSALAADWLAPAPYDRQFRSAIRTGPTREHPLGTDRKSTRLNSSH